MAMAEVMWRKSRDNKSVVLTSITRYWFPLIILQIQATAYSDSKRTKIPFFEDGNKLF